MKKLMVLVAAVALVCAYGCSGCGGQKQSAAEADSLAAAAKADSIAQAEAAAVANAMQIPNGTYHGVLPAADCPGIEVSLVLSTESSTLSELYLERDTEPKVIPGAASFDAEGHLVFTPNDSSEPASLYAVEGNTLRRLGVDGQPVTGELADKYVLTRQ